MDVLRETCDRWISQRATDDGMVRVTIQLLPEEAATLMKAVEAANRRALAVREAGAERQGRAPVDGLLEIAEAYLAGGDVSAETPVRPAIEVIVHREADGSAHLDDGAPVSAETARRLACDAALVEVTEDPNGEILDVGRRTRTIPAAIRRALRMRDGGCRFPGCTNRRFVDGHHIRHWSDGGETKLSNLMECCRRHHRYLHEYGFTVEVTEDGLVFRDPRGRAVHEAPRLPAPASVPFAKVSPPEPWDGSPVDYGFVIDGLTASVTAGLLGADRPSP